MPAFFIFLQAKYAGCVACICDKVEYIIKITPPGLW